MAQAMVAAALVWAVATSVGTADPAPAWPPLAPANRLRVTVGRRGTPWCTLRLESAAKSAGGRSG